MRKKICKNSKNGQKGKVRELLNTWNFIFKLVKLHEAEKVKIANPKLVKNVRSKKFARDFFVAKICIITHSKKLY